MRTYRVRILSLRIGSQKIAVKEPITFEKTGFCTQRHSSTIDLHNERKMKQ